MYFSSGKHFSGPLRPFNRLSAFLAHRPGRKPPHHLIISLIEDGPRHPLLWIVWGKSCLVAKDGLLVTFCISQVRFDNILVDLNKIHIFAA